MKDHLQLFRDAVIEHCPELIDILPPVDGISLDKFEEGSVVMTDTCNGAKKTNHLIAKSISTATGKTVHSLLCYNHLCNVWVKNVLKKSTRFLREYLYEYLDEISPILRVSPCLSGFARAFDREFSLCANYPKGHGQLFHQFMKKNHPGELLLHVERAESGGRQDVVSMASLAIYWNRNYCIEFLDYMMCIPRKTKDDSILVQNLFVVLSSLEMVAAARMWSIFHITIIMPLRWLSGNVHTLGAYKWCYFNLGNVLDRLKEKLLEIVDCPECIHDEIFMMSIIWNWKEELPPFKNYFKYQFQVKNKSDFVVSPELSGAKVVPLEIVRQELFNPVDEDNKASTAFVEEIVVCAAEAWIFELLDRTKGTYQFMSDSNSSFCWKNVTDDMKQQLMGKLAVNDLAESAFAGLTSQLKSFGRANLDSLAGVSDMMFNGFMDRPTTPMQIKGNQRGLLHCLPYEMRIALVKSAKKYAPATKKSNNVALERLHETKRRKEEVIKLAGITKAREDYIICLVYHAMSKTERCWKTAQDVRVGLARIKYVKDQELALRDNIQIRYLGMGFHDCHTTWTKDGKKKSIATLAARLIEIIDMIKDRTIPDRLVPKNCGVKRKELPVLGHLTAAVEYMYDKSSASIQDFDLDCRRIWKERDASMMKMQPGARRLDNSHVGRRIEIHSEFGESDNDDPDNIIPKMSVWCKGTIEEVYEDGESAFVHWDAIPSVGYPQSRADADFPPNNFNKGNEIGSWRFVVEIDYGV